MAKRFVLMAAAVVVLTAALIGGATMAWFTDSDTAGDVTFTAGTLSVNAQTALFYGVETLGTGTDYVGQGRLYEVSVENDVVSFNEFFESQYKDLNGAGLDRVNQRLYYANQNRGSSTLYFYDLKTGTGDHLAGQLSQLVWGATFGRGYYWYIDSNTDDLYRVSFKPDGTKDTVELFHENFAGLTNGFEFGDLELEMRDGIIYASTYNSPLEYFTYNIYTKQYTKVNGANATNLQIAFGADGVLYGHATRNGTWFKIDQETGKKTPTAAFYTDESIHLSDLASNYQNNWNPGDTDHIRYVFENTGSKNQVLRFSPSFSWVQQGLGIGNVIVSLCAESEAAWEQVGDYFYYVPVLEPGDTAVLCLNVQLSGPDTNDDYQGETLNLDGTVEAIQASNYAPYHQWGVNFYGVPTP